MVDALRFGIIGTGRWTQVAHLYAIKCIKNCDVVAICGTDPNRVKKVAKRFRIPFHCTDHNELLNRSDVDVIDITTSANKHYAMAMDAIESGKPILCEKPLATNYSDARALSERAKSRKVKTKVAFTFRYSPVIRQMKELVDNGFIGTPYLFNGFEQNSQWINPRTPFRWDPTGNANKLLPGSLEEYAPHLIDISRWFLGDLKSVSALMRNWMPTRYIRDQHKMMRINMDDCSVWLGEFQCGTQATFQSSYIAIGGYPGIEVRMYGSKGALIGRLVEEFGTTETLTYAKPKRTGFTQMKVAEKFYPEGYDDDETWMKKYFFNLMHHFAQEIVNDLEPEGNFLDGAKAEEVAQAVYLSHLKKRWVSMPLNGNNETS